MQLPSYPKVWTLGHKAITEIFHDPVVIQEKVDGSQISFGRMDGNLYIRSKGQTIHVGSPGSTMFAIGIEQIAQRQDQLTPGWIYRGEYLQKPKHNILAYNRVPRGHIALYDILTGIEEYVDPVTLHSESSRLDFEPVPTLFRGTLNEGLSDELLAEFLSSPSFLGGPLIEGVVVKNYHRFTDEGKVMLGKYVRPEFKEANKVEWKVGESPIMAIIKQYRHPLRWEKTVQHLRDQGTLQEAPQDIGPLLKEIQQDVYTECADEIKEQLFKAYWKVISRGITGGFPDWYKAYLANRLQPGERADDA